MKQSLEFMINRGLYTVPFQDMVYLEKQKRQVRLITQNGEYLFYAGFQDLLPRLDGRFYRCHRSYVLNLDHVRGVHSGTILMDNGIGIELGCKTYRRTRQRFEEYLRDGNPDLLNR